MITQESKITEIKVSSEYAGQRIDNFLFRCYSNVPKSHIYRLLRKKNIRVNRKRVHPDYHLQARDLISIPFLFQSQSIKKLAPPVALVQKLKKCILYENDDLLIINKPAGIPVHGGSGVNWGIIEMVRQLYPTFSDLELVHRLDKDTSGCLIIAKKHSMLRALHALWRSNDIHKYYCALTKGHWSKPETRVTAPLQKNILRSGERKVSISEEGKRAETLFCVKESFEIADLVSIELKTGRTHQIRVHAQYAGHAIAGDEKYGDRAFNHLMHAQGLSRLFLHAERIQFVLPKYDQLLDIKAPLDKDMMEFLERLR
jgi:23S rRNA pseudouridine955/2504/2580 synthase